MENILFNLKTFWQFTGFANLQWAIDMIIIGCFFIYLAIKKEERCCSFLSDLVS